MTALRIPGSRGRAVLAAAVCLAACTNTADDTEETESFPLAGLFTPGNGIGKAPPAAAPAPSGADGGMGLSEAEREAIEMAINEGAGSNRCTRAAAEDGATATPGKLDITFQTDTYGGFYTPLNCGAVWIEDSAGGYVSTVLLWAGVRSRNLFVWDARRCDSDRPDVISSATLDDHEQPHSASWNGKDHSGATAPDGMYVLNIEISEDEFNYGRRIQIPFEKGTQPSQQEPENLPSIRSISVSYTPEP